jgi:hypothetical protein
MIGANVPHHVDQENLYTLIKDLENPASGRPMTTLPS